MIKNTLTLFERLYFTKNLHRPTAKNQSLFYSTKQFSQVAKTNTKHIESRQLGLQFKQGRRMHVHQGAGQNSLSGIKATVFGSTSGVGMFTATHLSLIGSQVILPYRTESTYFDKRYREHKVVSDLGNKFQMKLEDFTDERQLKLAISNSNTIICTIGSNFNSVSETQIKRSNYSIPVAIAKAVAKSPNVQRAIFIGMAGADPFSPSIHRRQKYLMEKEVRRILPWATILRPTRMYDSYNPKNTWGGKWAYQMRMLTRKCYCVDPMLGQVQPVLSNDVALGIYQCVKNEKTMGETYDLGGPTTYTYPQIYEMLFNVNNIKPHVIPTTLTEIFALKHTPWLNPRRIFFGQYLSPEWIIDERMDSVVDQANKGFADLNIKPISFGFKVARLTQQIYHQMNTFEYTERDFEAN